MFCDCGGRIEAITYYDEETRTRRVSHGTCTRCLRNHVIEDITYVEFLRIAMSGK